MKASSRIYRKKVKTKKVDFYLSDKDIYEHAGKLNFQKFVKTALRKDMEDGHLQDD